MSFTTVDKQPTIDAFADTWSEHPRAARRARRRRLAAPPARFPAGMCAANVAHIVGRRRCWPASIRPRSRSTATPVRTSSNDIGASNEAWVIDMAGMPPAELPRAVHEPDGATARVAAGDGSRRRGTRESWTPVGKESLRAVHADPGVRLLDARTGHPRRVSIAPATSRDPPSTATLDEIAGGARLRRGQEGGRTRRIDA